MTQYRITLCTRDKQIILIYRSSVVPMLDDQIVQLPKDQLFMVEGRILTAHLPDDVCIVGTLNQC